MARDEEAEREHWVVELLEFVSRHTHQGHLIVKVMDHNVEKEPCELCVLLIKAGVLGEHEVGVQSRGQNTPDAMVREAMRIIRHCGAFCIALSGVMSVLTAAYVMGMPAVIKTQWSDPASYLNNWWTVMIWLVLFVAGLLLGESARYANTQLHEADR